MFFLIKKFLIKKSYFCFILEMNNIPTKLLHNSKKKYIHNSHVHQHNHFKALLIFYGISVIDDKSFIIKLVLILKHTSSHILAKHAWRK